MTHKEYNGHYNYETWVISLWMDNESGSYHHFRSLAAQAVRRHEHCIELADAIKEYYEEALPELNGFASDLLNGAMSEVNWREIAEGLMEEYREENPEEVEETEEA